MSTLLGRKQQDKQSSTRGKTGLLGRLDDSGQQTETTATKAQPQRDIGESGTKALTADGYRQEKMREIKDIVQEKVLARSELNLDDPDSPEVQEALEGIFNSVLSQEGLTLNRNDRIQLFEQVVDDILGFGPLEDLLLDEATSDIMVVGPDRVFVERSGRIYQTTVKFDDEDHLLRIIERVVAPLNRRIDETSPMVDARMPDGSRINAVIRPIALDGPSLTIRKFDDIPIGTSDLINYGTATPEVLEFLSACVYAGVNIMVTGGSSSGKTTFLNVLSGFIPPNERIVTIENAAELQLQQEHVVRMESRDANPDGEGQVTIRELVVNSLRMRPDRIVIGEVRAGEAIDLLQVLNSGRTGMSTAHANTPSDALARLETMCLMGGVKLPVRAIRDQIASAIDVVVQMARLRDGTRKITEVCEVMGMEGDQITLTTLFEWEQTGLGADGMIIGRLKPTGLEPGNVRIRIEASGIYLSPTIFGLGTSLAGRPYSQPQPQAPTPPQPESRDDAPASTESSSYGGETYTGA